MVKMCNADEWAAVVDRAARFHLDMTGVEFVRRFEAGEFGDVDGGPEGLSSVLPLLSSAATNR